MNINKLLVILLIFITAFTSCVKKAGNERKERANYIWINDSGEGRQVYLVFRRDFEVKKRVDCTINLYANSRYQLIVNGTFVNFGPVRAYPNSPEYDSYDITNYLKPGNNYIAVKVMNNGVTTYQVPDSPGGFIAWGKLICDGSRKDLSTPGEWKVTEIKGYDPTSPKMTFATGPQESFDERLDNSGWDKPEINEKNWQNPVELINQEHFGDLKPRSIPYLTQDEFIPKSTPGIYNLKDDEDIYSFRVQSLDVTQGEYNSNRIAFAYTYIYSPKKQMINAGLWWGDFYINGKGPLTEYSNDPDKFYTRDYPVELNQGWNYFFVKYGIVWASWDFYMSVPKSAGLIFSPTKDPESDTIFMTAGPFPDNEEQAARDKIVPFKDESDISDLSVEWNAKKRGLTAGNPALEIAWSYFDTKLDHDPAVVSDITLLPDAGKAMIFDMGSKILGRIFIDYEASPGTIVDIGFSEDMHRNRPWIMKRVGLYMGTRHISAGGRTKFETFKPYGAKYLHVNITNHTSPVKVHKIGMVSQIYPFEKIGSFECSDPMMNSIWELGWRTLKVCSEDTYTDTPFRERGLYAGDALPEYAITLVTSGDEHLIKRSISVFADMYRNLMVPGEPETKDNVNAMGDFPLITLQSYAWCVARTGDLEFARKYYDGYKNMCNTYTSKQTENGLMDHGRSFIEWTDIDKSANLTTLQSLIAQSLDAMAIVAAKLGKNKDASEFTEMSASIVEKMNELCWDDQKKAYSDGFKNGKMIDHHYPISSAWPLWFKQVPENRKESVRDHLKKTMVDIGSRERSGMATPYGSFYILGAMYDLGLEDLAEFYIRKYWSPMILKHNDTAWENFSDGSDNTGQGTLSHAWSGGPTYYLTTKVLGVDLGFPDFSNPDKILIAPQPFGISWARGKIPHPKGIIYIDWKLSGEILYLDYKAPDAVEVDIKPAGILAGKEIIINSRKLF